MLIAHLCLHIFHSWLSCVWPVPHVIIPCMTIPHVAQDELHKTCIFHATRKRGPHSHIMGLFKYLSCYHTCKNEVIIEQYRSFHGSLFRAFINFRAFLRSLHTACFFLASRLTIMSLDMYIQFKSIDLIISNIRILVTYILIN